MSANRVFKYRFFHREPYSELYIKSDIAELVLEPHDEEFIDLSGMVIGGKISDVDVIREQEKNILRISISSKKEAPVFNIKAKIRIPINKIPTKIFVTSDSGDIRLDGLPSKNIYLYTNNGDIMLLGVDGKKVEAENINGDIYIRGGNYQELSLTSTNGDILVEVEGINGRMVLETINGEIRFITTNDSNLILEASTINGMINIQNKEYMTIKSLESKFFQGMLKDGEGEAILKSVNGIIKIEVLEAPKEE